MSIYISNVEDIYLQCRRYPAIPKIWMTRSLKSHLVFWHLRIDFSHIWINDLLLDVFSWELEKRFPGCRRGYTTILISSIKPEEEVKLGSLISDLGFDWSFYMIKEGYNPYYIGDTQIGVNKAMKKRNHKSSSRKNHRIRTRIKDKAKEAFKWWSF